MRLRKFIIVFLILGACILAGCTADQASSASSEPVEANWTLHVDQTIPVEKDGMTVNYTLVLTADKLEGTDIKGTYKGNARLKVELDASKLPSEVVKLLGGFNMEASARELEFEVTSYNPEAFAGYYQYDQNELPMLTPIKDYTGMALVSPAMSGAGTLDIQASGIQGEKVEVNEAASGTEAIPMKILVSNAVVFVEVPTLKIGRMFEGQLLGEPVN
jgi:hypothetical protein